MIMQAKTSMRLNWAGRLAIVACAGLFLPLSPTWARQDEPLPPPDITARETRPSQDELKQREASDRFEKETREIFARLMKEPEPVQRVMRRALVRVVEQLYFSMKNDDLSYDSFLEALDRAADELRGPADGGGPVERHAREAWDRARKDLRELVERRQEERETLRMAARDRDEAVRELEQDQLDEQARARGGDFAQTKRELREARRQIAELQRQLRETRRRLGSLERGRRQEPEPRDDTRGRIVPLDRTESPRPPEPPRGRREPVNPATPARPGGPNAGPNNAVDGMAQMMSRMGEVAPPSDQDRRLRELESKMGLLLKELSELKKAKTPAKD